MPSIDLKGRTILVTRPKPAGNVLAEIIRAANGNALYLPLLEIVPLDFPKMETHFDWLIFISPQAVYHSAKYFRENLSENTKIAAIGLGTVLALESAGLHVDLYPKTDWKSEGLLALPEMKDVQGLNFALIQGEGGRPFLGEMLSKRGAIVTRLHVYRRQLPEVNVDFVQASKIDIIVTTSNDILQNLTKLFGPTLCHVPTLVISEKMYDVAKAMGFQKIFIAKNASTDAIMVELKRIIYGK